MTDTAGMTAAPTTLTLGDESYTLRPLTIADIGEFESWMRQQLIQHAFAIRAFVYVIAQQVEHIGFLQLQLSV